MHKVMNVEKTKMEEMRRMEDDYRISQKTKAKRNKSVLR